MSDRIEANEIIYPGQDRWSSNGEYQLILQEDCNFVLYRKIDNDDKEPIWASNTYNEGGSSNHSVLLQADGDFVLYNSDGQPLWHSGTHGYGASSPYVVVQDDGNVCMYDNEVEGCHWATGTSR